MNWPSYATVRQSGVPGIGEIPVHWSVDPIKHVVKPGRASIKAGPFGSDLTSAEMSGDFAKVYNQRTILDGDISTDEGRVSEEKFNAMRAFSVEPRDILITTRGSIGRAFEVPSIAEAGIIHPCVIRLRLDEARLTNEFCTVLMNDTRVARDQFDLMSNATTIDVIYSASLASLRVPVPPLGEQKLILAFLRRETAKIDALIAKQEQLIAILREDRTATITHAVTKGLNSHVETKDSGVEWIGEIPDHWIATRLGRLCESISDGPHFSPSYVDDGVMFLSARNIKVDGWSLDDAKFISDEDYKVFSRRVVPEIGDVLYTKGGTTGIARVVDLTLR